MTPNETVFASYDGHEQILALTIFVDGSNEIESEAYVDPCSGLGIAVEPLGCPLLERRSDIVGVVNRKFLVARATSKQLSDRQIT